MRQREPLPELALVGGTGGLAEVSLDAAPQVFELSLWLTGAEAKRLMPTGFWLRVADADMFFIPAGALFNRARFAATRVLAASDPAPRTPDVWLLQTRPLGPAQGGGVIEASQSRHAERSEAAHADAGLALGAPGSCAPDMQRRAVAPDVQARLTEVVLRLRMDWTAGPGQCWPLIYPVRDMPGSEFDHRVSRALREGVFCFSQFLGCLEVLLLQREQGSREAEETLLGVEQRLVELGHLRRELGGIADAQQAPADVDGGRDGAGC